MLIIYIYLMHELFTEYDIEDNPISFHDFKSKFNLTINYHKLEIFQKGCGPNYAAQAMLIFYMHG